MNSEMSANDVSYIFFCALFPISFSLITLISDHALRCNHAEINLKKPFT